MKILAGIILAVFLTGMLVAACFAVVNDDDSMAPLRVQLVRYDEQPQCYDDGYCDDNGQNYDQNYGSRDDRNRSRNRNRGAFSPGPFDRSPVDAFNGNTICLPGSTCYSDGKKKDQPPPDQGDNP